MEEEWVRTFNLHDPAKRHALPKSEIAHVIRSCGRLLTPAQMKDLLAPYNDAGLTREQFVELMRRPVDGPQGRDLLTALQAFDSKETGLLNRQDVIQMFTAAADKLPLNEVERILNGAPFNSEDNIPINALYDHLTQPYKVLKVTPSEVKAALA